MNNKKKMKYFTLLVLFMQKSLWTFFNEKPWNRVGSNIIKRLIMMITTKKIKSKKNFLIFLNLKDIEC